MVFDDQTACAHSKVSLRHIDYPNGTRSDYWECDSGCGAKFNPLPNSLTDNKTNLLRGARCYLIGHMEYAPGRDWRKYVIDELSPRGIVFFNPYDKPFMSDVPEDEQSRAEMARWREMGQWELLEARMKKVRAQDLRLVDISDFLIVNILPKVASWGSGEEITTAVREKKPLFLSIDDPKGKHATPLWFFGKIPHKYIYDGIEQVVEKLKAIDDGIIPMCSSRWRLLKPEYR